MLLTLLLAAALDCADPRTQADMSQCAGQAYAQADAAMARQWKVTLAYMKGRDAHDTSRGGGFGYAAALLASQRAWLKYRDTQCVIAGGQFAGGTAMPMAIAQCRTTLTKTRAAQLKSLVWSR